MNPKHLYALTEKQKQDYQIQPDEFPGFAANSTSEEYEFPPYMAQPTLRFWYNTQTSAFSTHWHDAQEIIIPLEEELTATVQNVTFRLKPGDILLIPPGELHSIEAPPCGSRFIFLLELTLFCQFGSFLRTQALLSKPVLITADACPEIYETEISLIMETAGHYWSDSPSKLLFIYACLMKFYAHYTDYCTGRQHTVSGHADHIKGNSASDTVSRLLEYLQRHYAENITLEEISKKADLSKFYFTRIFKQHTGQTFYDYLSFLRIQSAESLLKDTSVPVSDIAAACGYASSSSFGRAFRKYRNCSPLEYRSLHGHGSQ